MTLPPPHPLYAHHDSVNDDDNPAPEFSTVWGCLKGIRRGDAADGQPWPETGLPPGRQQALARTERAAVGLLTVAEILHAAERCRLTGTPAQHLDAGVVDGLFLALRGLAEKVCGEIRPPV
ncbi:MAG TPA: hypothetical protein DCP40_05270 [Stenotrophomonas sp.]|nr:hypothetical protein [Stenotrophomonas sp.]